MGAHSEVQDRRLLAVWSTLERISRLVVLSIWVRRNGDSELTDGVFVWPEGLAHYVAVHDVRLPEEFIERSRSMRFTIPIDLEDNVSRRREYDIDFWRRWCDRVGTAVMARCCVPHIPGVPLHRVSPDMAVKLTACRTR